MSAYYCTGATSVESFMGRCHIMDRSTHPMLSPSSVTQRLTLIQNSRRGGLSDLMVKSDGESTGSSQVGEKERKKMGGLSSLIRGKPSPNSQKRPYLLEEDSEEDSQDAVMNFIPIITDAYGRRPTDLPRVTVLTPVLTACYTYHGGVALVALDGLAHLLHRTPFFDPDRRTSMESSGKMETLTLLDLTIQVVCDLATSTARETIFQPCIDFVSDAIRFSEGALNTRTLGYAFRLYLFVFYFGASASFPSSTLSEGRDAPHSAAVALKQMISVSLGRLRPPTPPPPEKQSVEEFIQSIITQLIDRTVHYVDISNFTQIASHQIHRSGGSELFWHDMISSCGRGLFGKHNPDAVVAFAILASLVKVSSGSIRRLQDSGEVIPRDIHTKFLSLELLLHFLQNCTSIGRVRDSPQDMDWEHCHENKSPVVLAYTIRRLVVPSLLNNTVSCLEDPRVFQRVLDIVVELWRHFRMHLKVEIAVLFEHFVLRVLRLGPQVYPFAYRHEGNPGSFDSGQVKHRRRVCLDQQVMVLQELHNVFRCTDDILELFLNYDMDEQTSSNWRVFQHICGALCTFAEQCGDMIAKQIHYTRENRTGGPNHENLGDVAVVRQAARSLQAKSLGAVCHIVRLLMYASCQCVRTLENSDIQVIYSLLAAEHEENPFPRSSFKNDQPKKKNESGSSSELNTSSKSREELLNTYLNDVSIDDERQNHLHKTVLSGTSVRQRISSVMSDKSSVVAEKQADKKKTEESIQVAFEILDSKGLKQALDFLIACNVLTPSPRDIASFLRIHQMRIDPTVLGQYLGESHVGDEEYWNIIRYHYVRAISFAGMNVEEGLRHFLTRCGFRLPGESQQIDRIISTFAQCYWEDNAGDHIKCPFHHQDTVFLLSFAIIMLNTDLHKANSSVSVGGSTLSLTSISLRTPTSSNKKSRKKMTRQEFLTNLRGVDVTEELPKEYLSAVYDSVEANPISFYQTPTPVHRVDVGQNTPLPSTKNTSQTTQKVPSYGTSSAKSLTRSVKPALELLRGLSVHNHRFLTLEDDSSAQSEDFLRVIVHSIWHHFHGIVNATLDAVQLDPQGVVFCLEMLKYVICTTIILDMKMERKAFVIQLARIKFLNERGLEDGASRVYLRSVRDANFVVGEEFKREKWYKQMEDAFSSQGSKTAILQVFRVVKQLYQSMSIDTKHNQGMKKVTECIRNGEILLNDPTRTFLHEGDLIKKSNRMGRNTSYHFFLFSDVLIYGHKSSSKGDYKVHESLPLYLMKIVDESHSTSKSAQYGFQIQHPRKSFHILAPSIASKKEWINVLSAAIRNAVERKAGFVGAKLASAPQV